VPTLVANAFFLPRHLIEPERKMPTALTLSLVGIISPSEGG
jgi:hypothetical protein